MLLGLIQMSFEYCSWRALYASIDRYEGRDKESPLHSLSRFFHLLASQDAESTEAPKLSRKIINMVTHDGSHLVAIATAIGLALHTGNHFCMER